MALNFSSAVLNQLGAPAMYEDLIANRPAAGYKGRVFIGTDNNNIYRDTGTIWVQLGGSASGTVTSITGTANQVIASAATGAITLSLPQDIATSSSPTFAGISLSNLNTAGIVANNASGVLSSSSGTGFVKMSAGVLSYDNSTYISLSALSASSPLLYNNATGVFSIQVATGAQNGYLSSTDWTTFNSKQAKLNGTGFVKVSGTTVSYDNSTYISLTALSAASPLSYNNATGVFSIQVATGSQNGYLSSADWTTFNNKQAAISGGTGVTVVSNVVSIGQSVATSASPTFAAMTLSSLSSAGVVVNNSSGVLSSSSGTGFVKMSAGVLSYDNSTYISLSALSASSPLLYNNVTGVFSIQVATGAQNGYLSSTDWTTFNSKQSALSAGTGVTIAGGVVSIGQSVATSASPTFAAMTLTGSLSGTSASFTGGITTNGNSYQPLIVRRALNTGEVEGTYQLLNSSAAYATYAYTRVGVTSNTAGLESGYFNIVTINAGSTILALNLSASGIATFASSITGSGLNLTGATGATPFNNIHTGSGGQWQMGQNIGADGTDNTFGWYSYLSGLGVAHLQFYSSSGVGSAKFNVPLSATSASLSSTTASSSYTTGALVVSGGVGIAGNINGNGNILAINASFSSLSVAGYTYTTSTTLTGGYLIVYGGGGAAGQTLTFPAANGTNQQYFFKNVSGNSVTISRAGSDQLFLLGSSSGVNTYTLVSGGQAAFVSEGNNKWIQQY